MIGGRNASSCYNTAAPGSVPPPMVAAVGLSDSVASLLQILPRIVQQFECPFGFNRDAATSRERTMRFCFQNALTTTGALRGVAMASSRKPDSPRKCSAGQRGLGVPLVLAHEGGQNQPIGQLT